MTLIGLAGDWHGSTQWARHAIATFRFNHIDTVFQLGDFGLGWPGGWNQYLDVVNAECIKRDVTLYVVPGNHENYDWMDENLVYGDGVAHLTDNIKVLERGWRGDIDGRSIVALGGAPSIDFPHRMEGISWWPQEMIKLDEAEAVAAAGYADIMLAHDAPDGSTDQVQRIINDPSATVFWTDQGLAYAREGRELMNIAFAGVRPRVFAHGHYHTAGQRDDGRTKFLSLDCDRTGMNLVSLDTVTLEHKWLSILTELPK